MRRAFLVALAALSVSVALFLTRPDVPVVEAVNCSDFQNQEAAQIFLRLNPSDPEGLDGDRNGIACESNSCPCDRNPVARPGPVATNTPVTQIATATRVPTSPPVITVLPTIVAATVPPTRLVTATP